MNQKSPKAPHELLAPAGQPDAGYAALHYGADAVYCGLTAFSARAEAVNFTPDELALFARYAHSLTPRRRVYLTLNTLLQEDEVGRAVDAMAAALDCGVDALIIQDLGLAAIAREYFPNVELHASTQMAIHNLDSVRMAKELGFRRVTLARELTLAEIADICANGGVEIETFIHGTLCYSYSGLCLFSSMMTGRSGNRGRCVYSCREAAEIPETEQAERSSRAAERAHPFSLKDMALGDDVLKLAAAGVKSFKIEGRKKSPLYVGATVDYYRRILDGTFAPDEEEEAHARLQTIFARPWTKLFLHSTHNPDVADTEVVGHRGAPLGTIAGLTKTPAGSAIRFRPARAVERHDGIQIDIPGDPRPFGFAVDDLYIMKRNGAESAFAAPAGADIAVALPADAPTLSPGLPVYQSSSQEVKRSYPFARPRSETPEPDMPADIRITIEKTGTGKRENGEAECTVTITATAQPPAWFPAAGGETAHAITAALTETLPAFPARDAAGAEASAQKAFSRTGGSRFFTQGWTFTNPDTLFIKPGDWNALRRELLARLEAEYTEQRSAAVATVHAALADAVEENTAKTTAPVQTPPQWSLAVENIEQLDSFSGKDLRALTEIIIPHTSPVKAFIRLTEKVGQEKIRFALPYIARGTDQAAARERARERERARLFLSLGWTNWLVPSLGCLRWFSDHGDMHPDLCADWPLYAMNSQSIDRLTRLGFRSFTYSPEDDADNLNHLFRTREQAAQGWLTVHGNIPLFLSAACAHSNLHRCNHAQGSLPVTMEKSGAVTILPQGCGAAGTAGSCGSVVLSETPFSLLSRLDALRTMGAYRFRIDLRWRPRSADETLSLWNSIHGNEYGTLPGTIVATEANFSRRLE